MMPGVAETRHPVNLAWMPAIAPQNCRTVMDRTS
jgi:hypothetical protein